MLSRQLCGRELELGEETLISPTRTWHDTSATATRHRLNRNHLNSQQPRICFIFLIISTETKSGVECFRNQIILFSPGRVQLWTVLGVWDVKCLSRFILSVGSRRAVGRLDKFLHEDLKIVGCKIKRYFKMCLQQSAVFIGSIKASFGSAFWPPWSGGHFYKSSQTMTSSQTSHSSGQICCWWRSGGQILSNETILDVWTL